MTDPNILTPPSASCPGCGETLRQINLNELGGVCFCGFEYRWATPTPLVENNVAETDQLTLGSDDCE